MGLNFIVLVDDFYWHDFFRPIKKGHQEKEPYQLRYDS